MRILVTGGAGFIGSHVADRYLVEGHEVSIIDNLSTGRRENIPRRATFHHADIADADALERIFAQGHFDLVNHHAAQGDVRRSVSEPLFDAQVNLLGTLNLLECCRRHGVRQFVFISSGGVIYGEPDRLPIAEDAPKTPESPYGVAKLTAEHYLYYYRAIHGIPYVALRYANVYGPRQAPKSEATVVVTFGGQMLRGQCPTVFGDGQQTRDYIWIEDVVEANWLATCKLPELNRAIAKSIDDLGINIGTGVEISVNALYRELQELTGYQGDPIYAPPRPGELQRNALDGSKAAAKLDFRPRVGLRDGLGRTLDWLRAR